MGLFKKKSRVERLYQILEQDSNIYGEKSIQKWERDFDKAFKDMKKNGVPEELKEHLAYRFPLHCWRYGLTDMTDIIIGTKEMAIELPKVGYVPDEIGEFYNLEQLFIYGRVHELSPKIKKLRQLKTLSLIFDGILPEIIAELVALEELTLTHSRISNLPSNIITLKKLQNLELSYTNIENVPNEIYSMVSLRDLGLVKNKIQSISTSISRLENLEKLKLTDNPIEYIPKEVSNLRYLKYLYLEDTNIPENHKNEIKNWLPHTEITF